MGIASNNEPAWMNLDDFIIRQVSENCGGPQHFTCVAELRNCESRQCRSVVHIMNMTKNSIEDMKKVAALLGARVDIDFNATRFDGPYRFLVGGVQEIMSYRLALRLLISLLEARELGAEINSKPQPASPDVKRL